MTGVQTCALPILFAKVLARDVAGVISSVETLVADGRELGQFVVDFIWYLRNMLLLKSSGGMIEALDMSSENMKRLMEDAQQIGEETLIRYIRIFSELSGQMRYSSQKRVLLEIALIKLCRPQMEQDYSSLIERIEQLEKKLEEGITVRAAAPAATPAPKQEAKEPPQLPGAVPKDVERAVKNWRNILAGLPGLSRAYLEKARPTLGGDGELVLVFEDTMAAGYCAREEEHRQLEHAIAEAVGSRVTVVIRENDTNRPFEADHVDLEQVINMEITYEE